MPKHFLFPLVCFLCALCLLPSCKKEEPVQTEAKGTMVITSEPSGAEITILGKSAGTTPKTTNPVPAAMYIVKVSKDGYEPAWRAVNVSAGRQTDVDFQLEPEKATVLIASEPSGAQVLMDGREVGVTPLLLHDLPIGSYSATIQKDGYTTKRDWPWTVPNSRPFMVFVSLENNIGTLSMVTIPEGAEVEIDGKPYGITPLQEFLKLGPHRIRFSRPGYKPFEKIVTVVRDEEAEQKQELEVALEELPGKLSLESVPSGARVFINGNDYGETPYERDSIDSGEYEISLSMNGYDTLTETIVIHPGEQMKRSFNLKSNLGKIKLNVNPPGMRVYLDGKFVGRTEAEVDPDTGAKSRDISKPITLDGLPAGDHTIMVSNKHAKPNTRTITVPVGKGKTVEVPELTMWLPDTTIILKNGSKYTGRLTDKYSEDSSKISFRHSAGISTDYNRSEIREIVPLNIMDED